jgi:hypothetical protein
LHIQEVTEVLNRATGGTRLVAQGNGELDGAAVLTLYPQANPAG